MGEATVKDKARVARLVADALVAEFDAEHLWDGRRGVGTSPLGGHYPAPGLQVLFGLSLSFPPGVDDTIGADVRDALDAYVATVDQRAARALQRVGCEQYSAEHPWNRSPFHSPETYVLASPFPPIFDDEQSERDKAFFRPVTDAERQAYAVENGEEFPPFSDEQWVQTRYSGINLFRVAEWRPATEPQ